MRQLWLYGRETLCTLRTLEAVHFGGEDVFQGVYYTMATMSELKGENLGWGVLFGLCQAGVCVFGKLIYEANQCRSAVHEGDQKPSPQ